MISFQLGHSTIEDVEKLSAQPRCEVHTVEFLDPPPNSYCPQPGTGLNTTATPSLEVPETKRVKLWDFITTSFSDWWMGEMLAVMVSMITLLAIVLILRMHEDCTLPNLPYNMTLNTVISTLATVSKSSLLLVVASAIGQFKWLWISAQHRPLRDLQTFNQASRGPLGAVKLLGSRMSL